MTKNLSSDTQKKINSLLHTKEIIYPKIKPELSKKSRSHKPEHAGTLLSEEDMQVFQQIFDSMDKMEDLVVPTQLLIENLRKDERVISLLDQPAIIIPIVEKEIPVGQILDQIEDECEAAFEFGMHMHEYISWNQFIDNFKTYKKPLYTRSQMKQEY